MKKSSVRRKTTETNVSLRFVPSGAGDSRIATPVPFLNHLLGAFARFGRFDVRLKATGDVDVDIHHTVEDVAIALGEAVRKSAREGKGINRVGWAAVPMDDALVLVSLDLCGRVFSKLSPKCRGRIGSFDAALLNDFFAAFCGKAGCALHVRTLDGENRHHVCEAAFKAFGLALSQALSEDRRLSGRPLSTKGML